MVAEDQDDPPEALSSKLEIRLEKTRFVRMRHKKDGIMRMRHTKDRIESWEGDA